MELLELSSKNLEKIDKKLYEKIIKEYNYDLVIFIARGSYQIGKDLAEFNKVPVTEIFATRKGGKLKKLIRPLLQIIPKKIKKSLREKEFNSNIHEKNFEREISYNEEIWKNYLECKSILLVDDSVDTGYSIKFTKKAIEKFFTNSTVKVAALNCFEKSKKIVKTDFYIYKDTMLKGPWSNDSRENKEYLKKYGEWHEKQSR